MAKNVGKRFEDNFKKSVPENYCVLHRLKDSAQSFVQSGLTRFSWQNPCDFVLFDTIGRVLYHLELKSTKSKSITFEDINSEKEENKMIHKHQIKSLLKLSRYNNVENGFLFNFRDEIHNMERTYFQDITSFNNMCEKINKCSFNEIDLLLNNAIKIEGTKKRVNYTWDIDKFLSLKRE